MAQKTSITDIINDISLIKKEDSSNYELEIRWRLHNSNNGIPYSKYKDILDQIRSSGNYEIEVEKDTVTGYEDDIRKISLNDKKIKYQKKEKIKDCFIQIGENYMTAKVSLSKEINLSNPDVKKILYIRNRERISCRHRVQNFKIDITKVENEKKEIKYEFELEYKNLKDVSESDINRDIKGITNTYFNEIYSKFKKTIYYHTKTNQYESKSTNITRDILNKNIEYAVTNKLDGVSCYIYILNNKAYLIRNYNVEELFDIKNCNSTILQGEWYNRKCYIFDSICITNDTLFEENFSVRYKKIEKFFDKNLKNNKRVELKTFFMGKDLYKNVKDCLKHNSLLEKEKIMNDGIIFTPLNEPFKNDHTYKFKYPEMMTIDFKVKQKRSTKNGYEFELHIGVEVFHLTSIFNPIVEDDKKIASSILIDNDNKDKEKINENSIIECRYDIQQNKWIYYRLRKDKIVPNFYTTAYSVFNDIINPITSDMLLEYIRNATPAKMNNKSRDYFMNMRTVHNEIKRKLIAKYCEDKVILDLGYGAGGDNHKYNSANIKKIYAVEPNIENIKEAKSRLRKIDKKYSDNVYVMFNRAQDTDIICKQILKINKNVFLQQDVVASFFSLSFFFKTENDLNKLILTIDKNLKKDGFFVGTTIDGELLYKYFEEKKKNKLEVKNIFSIKRLTFEKPTFGSSVQVHYDNTIVQNQTEYYVLWSVFVNLLRSKNIYLKSSNIISMEDDKSSNTSDELKINDLCKFYRTFVFKKESNSNTEIENLTSSLEKVEITPTIDIIKDIKNLSLNNSRDLNILDFGSREFISNDMVRIGVVGDGSCFFHAVVTAFKEYNNLPKDEIKSFVRKIRAKLSSELSKDKFENNIVSVNCFVSKVHKILEKDYLKEDRKRLWNALIDKQNVFNFNDLESYAKQLSIDKDPLFTRFREEIYIKYKSDLMNTGKWVGLENAVDAFNFFSEAIEHNIFVCDSNNNYVPLKIMHCNKIKQNWPNIFILVIDNIHFELLGRFDESDNSITTTFLFDDLYVQHVYQSLCAIENDN